MRGVAIDMEGGGPGRTGRAALRQGMDHFPRAHSSLRPEDGRFL